MPLYILIDCALIVIAILIYLIFIGRPSKALLKEDKRIWMSIEEKGKYNEAAGRLILGKDCLTITNLTQRATLKEIPYNKITKIDSYVTRRWASAMSWLGIGITANAMVSAMSPSILITHNTKELQKLVTIIFQPNARLYFKKTRIALREKSSHVITMSKIKKMMGK